MEPASKSMALTLFTTLKGKVNTQIRQVQMDVMNAISKQTQLSQDYADAKKAINAEYEYDNPQREVALQEVDDEFEFLKAQAYEYQTEQQTKLNELKTKSEMYEAYTDKLREEVKEDAKEAHTYGYKT